MIGEWIDFYNTERPHPSLAGQPPAEVLRAGQPVDMNVYVQTALSGEIEPVSKTPS